MLKKLFVVPRAFTLIELLIVVAIIAILAAIAVPNFLEAQVRAKVSRAKSDIRSLTTAMESYYVDHNKYPPCNTFGVAGNNTAIPPPGAGSENYPVLENLSTPIAYITSGIIPDAFSAKLRTGSVYTGTGAQPGMGGAYSANTEHPLYHSYQYLSVDTTVRANVTSSQHPIAKAWVLSSCGPDNIYINMGGVIANNSSTAVEATAKAYCANLYYDPTNGTVSFGELYRVGGNISNDYGHYFFQSAAANGLSAK